MERGAVSVPRRGEVGEHAREYREEKEDRSVAVWGGRCVSGGTPQCSALLFGWELHVIAV